MKKKYLELITSTDESQVEYCKILNRDEHSITFEVDENLELGDGFLHDRKGSDIIAKLLDDKQIESSLHNVIASSFGNKEMIDMGSDVLYKTIITCYGQHRPLVLSPDMIWLLIAQTLAKHVDANAEKYRNKIVNHSGKMDVVIESSEDLLSGKPDWSSILDGMYDKIEKNTRGKIASTIVSDFSTTSVNERIASIATLMNGVQSYFRYTVYRMVCGIPYITLKGSKEDWVRVLQKAAILKRFDLGTWYSWLAPILSEFAKASDGKPNRLFWKNIVRRRIPVSCPAGGGCIPEHVPIDGWCTALFPYKNPDNPDNGRLIYEHSLNIQKMESEILRVGFKYVRIYPDGQSQTFSMELWSGMVGAEEDPKTHSLTPVVGWFIRQSDEEKESLERL